VTDRYQDFAKAKDFNDASFWDQARRMAGKLPFAKDMMAMYHCMQDANTPLPAKATIAAALAYFVLPADMVPDFIPMVGFADDAGAIAAALAAVRSSLKREHYEQAEESFN
jgi:uncharacterized membrane protein YkvA (DUF1232 family)